MLAIVPDVLDKALSVIFRSLGLEIDLPAESLLHAPIAFHNNVDAIGQFDHHIEAYNASLIAINERVILRIRSLSRQRNALLPIHRLPAELLSTIFILTVHTTQSGYTKYTGPSPISLANRLTGVCSNWRDLALQTAALWNNFHPSDSAQAISRALPLSKEAPLYFNHPITDFPLAKCSYASANQHTRLFTLALPYVQRWRSAHFHIHSASLLRSCVSKPAEMLQDFDIFLHVPATDYQTFKLLNLFQGQAGNLKNVTLSYPVQWTSGALSGLKSLEMCNIPGIGPSIEDIRRLLECSPALKALALYNIDIVTGYSAFKDPIELPLLTKFVLDLSLGALQAVLNIVRAPNLMELSLTSSSGTSSLQETLNAFAPFLANYCRRYGSGVGTLVFRFCDLDFDVSFHAHTGPIINIAIVHPHLNPATSIRWMVANGGSTLSEDWKIKAELENNLRPDIPEAICAVTGLSDLAITTEGPLADLLEYLATPLAPGGPWPLAKLSRLAFEGGVCSAEAMLGMLRGRYKRENGGSRPRRLDILNLSDVGDLDSRACEKIRAMLGRNHVIWDTIDNSDDGSGGGEHPYYDDDEKGDGSDDEKDGDLESN